MIRNIGEEQILNFVLKLYKNYLSYVKIEENFFCRELNLQKIYLLSFSSYLDNLSLNLNSKITKFIKKQIFEKFKNSKN